MNIILKSITLVNFMGEKNRRTDFNMDAPTTIQGMNGLGKSRHFDAFTWLMFGKDSADRKDYEIKSIVDGKPLQKCECSVEGELVIDGELVTIKRSLVEQWVKPRGCVDQVFKGNQTECTWNGVPVKVNEFQKRINDIINETIFKMLTNPLYFANMPWKNQREQLFQLAGNINAADIASGNPEFERLMDAITGKSLEEYKKELAFKKSRLKAELETIQPRIDQTNTLMPESADFDAIEREIAEVDAAIAQIDKEIADITSAVRSAYQAEQDKVNQVNAIRTKMQHIVFDAMTANEKDAHAANAKRRDTEQTIWLMERDLTALQNQRTNLVNGIAEMEKSKVANDNAVASLIERRDAFRAEVIATKSKVYDGSSKCPHCGQEMPADMLADIETRWNESKARDVAAMVARGQAMNADIERQQSTSDEYAKRIAHDNELVADLDGRITTLTNNIDASKGDLANTPIVNVSEVNPQLIPEWVELDAQAKEIESTINANIQATADTNEYTDRKGALNERRASLVNRLSSRDTIAMCNKAIAELNAKAKDLAQQIADIEKDEYTIQEFNAANIAECERRINGLFQHVTFRLFEHTIDGNPIETCIPLVNGVPFGRANTAGRINAGLDIINALCRHYDTFAPIFLDNAESVNRFTETGGQVIMMRVTTDEQLTIL